MTQPTRNQRGSSVVLVLGVLFLVGLLGSGLLRYLALSQDQSARNREKATLIDLENDVRDILTSPRQCGRNLAAALSFAKGSDISAKVSNVSKLAFTDASGNVLNTIAEAGVGLVDSIQLKDFVKGDPAGSSVTLTVKINLNAPDKVVGPTGIRLLAPRRDLEIKNLSVQMSEGLPGVMNLSSCSLTGLSLSVYRGKLIGAPLVTTKHWNAPLGTTQLTESHNYDLSAYPGLKMIDLTGVCSVTKTTNAGTGVRAVLLNGSGGQIIDLNLCYKFGTDPGLVETFKAGQFFKVPANAKTLQIIFTADAGNAKAGNGWDASATANFFE